MIVVEEVRSKRQLKAFVKFPFELYKDSRYWVPPIIKEEMAVFNPSKNPILQNANLKLFLAYKKGGVVGRDELLAAPRRCVNSLRKMRMEIPL